MSDSVYWQSTPRELGALLDAHADETSERQRAATLRAGLVASAVYNVHRKKGAPRIKPTDFVREPTREVSPEQAQQMLTAWAEGQNQREH